MLRVIVSIIQRNQAIKLENQEFTFKLKLDKVKKGLKSENDFSKAGPNIHYANPARQEKHGFTPVINGYSKSSEALQEPFHVNKSLEKCKLCSTFHVWERYIE